MHRLVRIMMLFLVALSATAQPAAAQSVLRDAETEAFLNEAARPLILAAGLNPGSVEMVLLNDDSINAFVAQGQAVYMHSGLITAADNAGEVQGVIAHELGHLAGGHVLRFEDGMKMATGISLLSLVLGAVAMAAGAGEAGAGILQAGQHAAMSQFLAFNRTQESTADQAGSTYLRKAGISGKGAISFFKKLQNQEFRLAIPQDDSYARTHPLSGDRVVALREALEADPAWNKPSDRALEARFQRIKAKLQGFVNKPELTLVQFPEHDRSVGARYARAYAWHKNAYPQKAMAEVDSLLAEAPRDPYFLELKGQILLESGKPAQALPPLREAVAITNNEPLISALLGHALVASENKTYLPEARQVLRTAVAKDNDNPFAWYQLGVIYSQEGDQARAALATAERYSLQGNAPYALRSAQLALAGIRPGTPDCLRAQDIAMTSHTLMVENKRMRKAFEEAGLMPRGQRWREKPTVDCRGA